MLLSFGLPGDPYDTLDSIDEGIAPCDPSILDTEFDAEKEDLTVEEIEFLSGFGFLS